MKINNIAKAILLPVLMLPLAGVKASDGEDKKDRVIPAEKILFPNIGSTEATVLALPRNVDPMSLALFELNRKFDRKNYISEIIVDKKRVEEEAKCKVDAYYRVDTENNSWFYIARKNEGRTDNLFLAVFDQKDKRKGTLFLEPPPNSTLVTTIDAKEIGLDGAFEIYDKNGWYYVNYKFSPLINTPNHTKVSSVFLLNIERELQKFPKKLTNELTKQGVKVMIGGNVEDTYYHYYPSWKQYDDNLLVDPKRPAYEQTEDGWRDNRKYANTGGVYISGKVIIPQRYSLYASNKTYDYATSLEDTRYVLYHELGHAIDYMYGEAFSASDAFKNTHSTDIKTFTKQDIKDLAYFYRSRSETFAQVSAALLGGLPKRETESILSKFPMCAEHIRQNVLPRFDINLTKEQIRKDIYPRYLMKEGARQTKLSLNTEPTTGVIIPPDLPQEIITASLKSELKDELF